MILATFLTVFSLPGMILTDSYQEIVYQPNSPFYNLIYSEKFPPQVGKFVFSPVIWLEFSIIKRFSKYILCLIRTNFHAPFMNVNISTNIYRYDKKAENEGSNKICSCKDSDFKTRFHLHPWREKRKTNLVSSNEGDFFKSTVGFSWL